MHVQMTPRSVRRVVLPMMLLAGLTLASCNKTVVNQQNVYTPEYTIDPETGEISGLEILGNMGQAGMNIDSTLLGNIKDCVQDLDSLVENNNNTLWGGFGGGNP